MTVYEIIKTLKKTPSTNAKREILREHADNHLFRKVLTHTFDPRITYGIKKIPNYDYVAYDLTLDEAIDELQQLISRERTGNDAILFLQGILETVSEEDAEVIKWIIAKDFKAGFGVSLVNDEMGDFKIYEVPYMGATGYSEKRVMDIMKKGRAFSEVKMDGRYLNCVVTNSTNVFMESRGGKPNPLMGCLEEEAKTLAAHMAHTDVVFNGELMFKGEPDRYIANGIISSFVSIAQKEYDGVDISKERVRFEKRHGLTIEEAKTRINFVVWDYLPYDKYLEKRWDETREIRLAKLKQAVMETGTFEIIEYRVVNSVADAIAHFQEMLARGEEGTILKEWTGIWEDKKPNYQVKMKLEISTDLRIVGFNYGTPGTKNENVISSINVESMCGVLSASPGGISESDMKYITENMDMLLGKIVEVKSSGTSRDSEGNWSLLHPVFNRLRLDKNTGDDLNYILNEIEAPAKGLKSEITSNS